MLWSAFAGDGSSDGMFEEMIPNSPITIKRANALPMLSESLEKKPFGFCTPTAPITLVVKSLETRDGMTCSEVFRSAR
jgi:hypothetical protein